MANLQPCALIGQLPIGHPYTSYIPKDYNQERPYAVSDGPMLHLCQGGANFLPVNRDAWSWKKNVGYVFIEFPLQAKAFLPYARRYFDHIIAGSSWCEDQLADLGLTSISHAIQGIDFDTFHPTDSAPLFGDSTKPRDDSKFYIFSGGKAEYRKGTDIVIAAFKVLADKYPDMHLIASWGNHWPETMSSLRASKHLKWNHLIGLNWMDKIRANMALNKINGDRYTLLGFLPNSAMAKIYHSCHLGVFPNRCEAGTNMVLTEFMACGVPVVATAETGQRDVVGPDHAWCDIDGVEDPETCFFEPTLDSVIAEIERAYQMRSVGAELGIRGSEFIKQFTWAQCAEGMLNVCM